MSEYRDVSIKVSINTDGYIVVPDSPELRSFLRSMELGSKVLDMRKRNFLFFKRRLKPHEKAKELLLLQLEDLK